MKTLEALANSLQRLNPGCFLSWPALPTWNSFRLALSSFPNSMTAGFSQLLPARGD